MAKQKDRTNIKKITYLSIIVAMVGVFGVGLVNQTLVFADRFEEQIRALSQENANKQEKKDELGDAAVSLTDKISKLQNEINAMQAKIDADQNRANELQKQIVIAEEELVKQKKLLGENIKAMYVEGQISTIEMLASSKDLSDFVDKQEYRNIVKDKIKGSVDKVTALKHELKGSKEELDKNIKQQKIIQADLDAKQRESNQLLGLNQDQQNAFNQQIAGNTAKIIELRQQQAAQNARLFGGGGGVAGGGGYPWGNATCLHTGQAGGACWNYDWVVGGGMWDSWGYGYRNCTSWTAYRVASTGRFMPYGLGNANTWDDRAAARGYAVDGNPRVGDAAVSNSGYYGHVMYVEAVHGDGSIVVSDYNRMGDGLYRMTSLSASQANSLVYVHL